MSALLCSYRETARLLGVGRGEKLHKLIKAGLLRPVTLIGRAYIPREQIEELARNGDKGRPVLRSARVYRRSVGLISDIEVK